MISPQSIAVAAAAGGLVGRESELFRFSVKHSFIMLFFICLIVFAQAYVLKWLIPVYEMISGNPVKTIPDLSTGYLYLAVLVVVVFVIALAVKISLKSKKSTK
jgi:lactate permease